MSHRPTPWHCALDWLGRSAGVLALAIFCLYLYSEWVEKPFLSYKAMPFDVLRDVRPGEAVPVALIRCNTTKQPRTYLNTRELVNVQTGEIFPIVDMKAVVQPGCQRVVIEATFVPLVAPPGEYYLHGLAITRGVMSTHEIPWQSERFRVLPATP